MRGFPTQVSVFGCTSGHDGGLGCRLENKSDFRLDLGLRPRKGNGMKGQPGKQELCR